MKIPAMMGNEKVVIINTILDPEDDNILKCVYINSAGGVDIGQANDFTVDTNDVALLRTLRPKMW
jgi:hypothetical protein